MFAGTAAETAIALPGCPRRAIVAAAQPGGMSSHMQGCRVNGSLVDWQVMISSLMPAYAAARPLVWY
jgi:hypothetical protein